MQFSKTWYLGKYTVILKRSNTPWYSKSKSGESREYPFLKIAYLVSQYERMVGFNVVAGKSLLFIGWQRERKTKQYQLNH